MQHINLSIEAELAAQGLRIASHDEPGWTYRIPGDYSLWVTNAPAISPDLELTDDEKQPPCDFTPDTRVTTPELAAVYRVARALQGLAPCEGATHPSYGPSLEEIADIERVGNEQDARHNEQQLREALTRPLGASEAMRLLDEAETLDDKLWAVYVQTEFCSDYEAKVWRAIKIHRDRVGRRREKKIRACILGTLANEQERLRVLAARQLRKADSSLTYYQSIKLMRKLTLKQCVTLARAGLFVTK